ncbi:MAG TPA: alpha/beta hydrolase [Acidimicrobiia bacterium]|nr:alpha/beta hydrolase [Acidimicrobiia bacterium]
MKAIAVVAGLAVLGLAATWLFQRSLIYFPIEEMPSIDTVLPGGEEVTFPTEDGIVLTAWYLPVPGDNETTVIVFNGNAGNRSHRAPLARALTDQGFAVLLTDYRGYGGNPGSPSEEGLILDAAAALAYLERRPDVDSDRLVFFGESLGASVALRLASDHPPAGLILRSPFTSLAEVGEAHYPLLPVSWMLRDRYENTDLITQSATPLLIILGTADGIVPPEQSRRLYDAASAPRKRIHVIDGADHNDPSLSHGAEMVSEMAGFLDDALG